METLSLNFYLLGTFFVNFLGSIQRSRSIDGDEAEGESNIKASSERDREDGGRFVG